MQLSGNISDYTSLTIETSGNSSISGAISGAGGLTVQGGAGVVTLSGANTYTGATTVNGGELELTGDALSAAGDMKTTGLSCSILAAGMMAIFRRSAVPGRWSCKVRQAASCSWRTRETERHSPTPGARSSMAERSRSAPACLVRVSGRDRLFLAPTYPATFREYGYVQPSNEVGGFNVVNLFGGFGAYDILNLASVTGVASGPATVGSYNSLNLFYNSGIATVQFSQNYVGQEFGIAVDPENGGVDIALYTTNFDVTTTAQLAFALQAISVGGVDSTTGTQYTITIGADSSGLSSDLPAINLASGDALTINGGNYTLDAGGTERGLFVEFGTVSISDLTIKDAVAVGGSGGLGRMAAVEVRASAAVSSSGKPRTCRCNR